jgi:hypothetical protein
MVMRKWLLLLLISFSFAEKDFFWKSVDVSVFILKNGDIQVKEKQILHFIDKFTFGFRTIPTFVHGKNDGIKDLKLVEYTKNGIVHYKHSTSSKKFSFVTKDAFSSDLSIFWYFPETSGIHTYEFSYTVKRAIRKNKTSKELFWKLIPSDHQQIIEKFNSRISFEDSDVKVKSKKIFINGDENLVKKRNGFISENQHFLNISCDHLFQGDYFEVKLIYDSEFEIEQGLWVERESISRSLDFYFLLFGIVYVLTPLILVYWVYKEPNVVDSFDSDDSLPSNLPPALASSLISNAESSTDVVATLINLCRKGYLKIEDTGTDWIFIKVKSFSELDEHEIHIVNHLFLSSNSVTLSSLDKQFYQHLGSIYQHIQIELKTRSLIHTIPSEITRRMIILGLFFPISSICISWVQFYIGLNVRMYIMHIFSAIGFLMILYYSFSRSFNVKTISGTQEAKKWKNFKNYLTKVSRGDGKIQFRLIKR